MRSILLILLAIGTANADIKWLKCDETTTGTIDSLSISDCKSIPCIFYKESNYTLNIQFSTVEGHKVLKSEIAGRIGPVWISFPFNDEYVCKDTKCGLKCPIPGGQKLDYTATLPVLDDYPNVEVLVRWKMVDATSDKSVWCFEVPVKIVKKQLSAIPRSVQKLHL